MKIAVIREQDCVGCGKCLPACPVDAIVGAAKFLHTVITSECIGCELCVAPCPTDCIEMLPLNSEDDKTSEEASDQRKIRAMKAKKRYSEKQQRMLREKPLQLSFDTHHPSVQQEIRQNIQAAYDRVENKRRDMAHQCNAKEISNTRNISNTKDISNTRDI